MEDMTIREGFNDLRPGVAYDALYQSALCRQKADWLVGINATRLFSVLYHRTLNAWARPDAHTGNAGGARRKDQWFPEGEIPLCAAEGGRLRGGFGEDHLPEDAQAVKAACSGASAVYLRHP